jgi:hypothetical protein
MTIEPGADLGYKVVECVVVAASLDHIHHRKKIKADFHGVGKHRNACLFQGITKPSLINKPTRS